MFPSGLANIVVLNKGKIVEIGAHKELTELKGEYYHLEKKQLELEKLGNPHVRLFL